MPIRIIFTSLLLLFITSSGFAYTVFERGDFAFSFETYFRTDLSSFNNTVDLDSSNKEDKTTYLGIDYNLSTRLKWKDAGPEFYLKVERNGPSDYNAPIFASRPVLTSGGVIDKYRGDELLPGVKEFWLDAQLAKGIRIKPGLYAYSIGNGFSLNGGFENYGVAIYQEAEKFDWRIYYCKPDLSHKTRLGPRIHQDQEQDFFYEPNAANLFSADARLSLGVNTFEPYIGALVDYTSPGKRDDLFTAPIKRDILGTFGLAYKLENGNLCLKSELAKNFGGAKSADPEYKDITHTGYLIFSDLKYKLQKFTPSLQLLYTSGNKVTPDMAQNLDTTFTSGKNKAFSTYSPLNFNLDDVISASHADIRPIVAMGSGYSLNYGVLRPGTFAVADFDNIFVASIGFDYSLAPKLNLGVFFYNLRSVERGVGTLNGEGKYLSRDLGREVDLFVDYNLNEHAILSFEGGYLWPGKYHKEIRDDTGGSIFSPYVRGDGSADPAYQLELSLELAF